jgi:carbonic anhydrase
MKIKALMLCVSLCYICNGYSQETHIEAHTEQQYLIAEQNSGTRQSPINILSSDSEHKTIHKIKFNYHPSTETVVKMAHTVQVNYDPGNTIGYKNQWYDFKQFHFHTPSEHLIDGVTYPMELHMVHLLQQSDSQMPVYLVVGLLFKEGEENPFLNKFLNIIPDSTGAVSHLPDQFINISDLLAQAGHLHYYHYDGSLTTPPFTETVTWMVVKHVFEASPAQIEKLNRIEGNNARHFQDLHDRKIESN